MRMRIAGVFAIVLATCPPARAMEYVPDTAVKYSEKHFSFLEEPVKAGLLNCQRYVYRSNLAGGLRVPEKPIPREDWPDLPQCKRPEFPTTEDEFMKGYRYLEYLRDRLKCPYAQWSSPQLPSSPSDIENRLGRRLRPGDDMFFIWQPGDKGHAVIVVDTSSGDILFKGQNARDPRSEYKRPLFGYVDEKRADIQQMAVVHIPDSIGGCRAPRYVFRNDSNVGIVFGGPPEGHSGRIVHKWICCWHENLGGGWPWYSDSSAYACLSWTEARGTTWDTLISPRMNFAACSSVVLRLRSNSSLSGGSISVRGSTDDGQTWPYYVGDDHLTEASLSWAAGQRNARLAWCYHGPVQVGRYWCIDDMEVWARPSRDHDVSVSALVRPCGAMSPGTPVVPSALVWNHGRETESIPVTMSIGQAYNCTRWVKLYPFNDTLLEFAGWTAVPGTYTATCFVALDGDECRANDTACLTFKVVADTWVSRYPVYGGGTSGGACMTGAEST